MDDFSAEWVKAARAKAGLTLEQLGELVGRTKANVSHWEKGKHSPSYAQMLVLSRVTGHPLPSGADLVFEDPLKLGNAVGEHPTPPDTLGRHLLKLSEMLKEASPGARAAAISLISEGILFPPLAEGHARRLDAMFAVHYFIPKAEHAGNPDNMQLMSGQEHESQWTVPQKNLQPIDPNSERNEAKG